MRSLILILLSIVNSETQTITKDYDVIEYCHVVNPQFDPNWQEPVSCYWIFRRYNGDEYEFIDWHNYEWMQPIKANGRWRITIYGMRYEGRIFKKTWMLSEDFDWLSGLYQEF